MIEHRSVGGLVFQPLEAQPMIVSLRDGETLADYAYRITAERNRLLRAINGECELSEWTGVYECRPDKPCRGCELRDRLARLTAERDAALALLKRVRGYIEFCADDPALLDEIDALLSKGDS